jgi:hypothetical protein
MTTSLLDIQASQPELIPASEMPPELFGVCQSEPRSPVFTAGRYHQQNPEEYKLMVSLLFGDMLPIATVARMLGRSRNLVDAVYTREAASKSVEQLKQQASREYRHLGKLGREALRQYMLHLPAVENLDINQLSALIQRIAVAIGIVDDKAELLSGGPTARIEHTSKAGGHEAVLGYLDKLRKEYAARMGTTGENPLANGAIDVDSDACQDRPAATPQASLPGAPVPAAPEPTVAPDVADSDKESEDLSEISQ